MTRQVLGVGNARQLPPTTFEKPSQFANRSGRGVLRTRRSSDYLRMPRTLDAGPLQGRADLQPVYDAIAAEFTPSGSAVPKGILARCYLGEPFEVHVLDLFHEIVEHYERSRPMPQPEEGYRALALHPDYVVVEIYDDRILCVRGDGDVVQIDR